MTRRRPGNPPAGGSNPNLLLAPEDAANAAWLKPAVTVTSDTGDPTHPNADQLVMPASRQKVQDTTIDATSGSGILDVVITTSWARYAVTGVIDGVPYTFSEEYLSVSGVTNLRIQVNVSPGNVIRVGVYNQSGSTATFLAWGAKLEQADAFSQYP